MVKYLNDYKWIFVFAAITALAAGIFAWQKDKDSVSLSLTISRAGTQNSADYKYDSYYALKASDEFGDTVEGWFKTPETVQAIYKQAGRDFGGLTLADLSRRFQAAKISPTAVEVRFGAASEDDAKNISQAIVSVAVAKADLLKAKSDQGMEFAVIGGEPVIINNSNDIWRNAFIGLVMGLIVGIFVKVGKEYFKEQY